MRTRRRGRVCFTFVGFFFFQAHARVLKTIGSVGIQIRSVGIAVGFLPPISYHPLHRPQPVSLARAVQFCDIKIGHVNGD